MKPLERFGPLIAITLILLIFFGLGLNRYFTLDALAANRAWMTDQVNTAPLLSAIVFVALYAGLVSISFPGASILTLFAGFLFGPVAGGLIVVCGATLGATGVFLAAQRAAGAGLLAKAGPRLKEFEAGFRANAFSYLLTLRLVPLFPFWLVNLAAAPFGVPVRTYMLATFLGIIPATFVYASLGSGLGAILDAGAEINMKIIFTAPVLLPLLGLAGLSLIPVFYKRLRS